MVYIRGDTIAEGMGVWYEGMGTRGHVVFLAGGMVCILAYGETEGIIPAGRYGVWYGGMCQGELMFAEHTVSLRCPVYIPVYNRLFPYLMIRIPFPLAGLLEK